MKSQAPIIALVALALATTWHATSHAADGRGVVYPPSAPTLHLRHGDAAHQGVTCLGCHPAAAGSRSAVDNLRPQEAQCKTCHVIARDAARQTGNYQACETCHPGAATGKLIAPVTLPPPALKFDHVKHGAYACQRCHPIANGMALRPTMDSCLTCHRGSPSQLSQTVAPSADCGRCHLRGVNGLYTDLPDGKLMPTSDAFGDRHGPGFVTAHATAARMPNRTCENCHQASYCLDCHNGVVKPAEFHAGNYLQVHAVDAKRQTTDCSACHRATTFCTACHQRSGVTMTSETRFGPLPGATQFHPAGWVHGVQARRNLTSCASCHRENECLACHSAQAGAPRASPHPQNWRGSAQCRAMDAGNRRLCLRCHTQAEELGCEWSAAMPTLR